MRIGASFALAIGSLALVGCAAVMKNPRQTIWVITDPVVDAECTMSSAQGSVSFRTPAYVSAQKRASDLTIRCAKPGYEAYSATVHSKFDSYTLANIALGNGVAGIGFIVDDATGSMNQYPYTIHVEMRKVGSTRKAQAGKELERLAATQ